jgi:hypothetical protein
LARKLLRAYPNRNDVNQAKADMRGEASSFRFHAFPVPGDEWRKHSAVNSDGYLSFSPGHHPAHVLA